MKKLAKYQCNKCNYIFKEKAGPVICPKCKYFYLTWLNYESDFAK